MAEASVVEHAMDGWEETSGSESDTSVESDSDTDLDRTGSEDERTSASNDESEEEIPLCELVKTKNNLLKAGAHCLIDSETDLLKSQLGESKAHPPSSKKRQYTGLLSRLSLACRLATRKIAGEKSVMHVYDNINWILKAIEQILGRSQSQENGTCATIFPLYNTRQEDMKTKDLLASLEKASLLKLEDITLTLDEQKMHRECMIHAVLRILINFGGEHYACFKKEVDARMPQSEDLITLHKTDVYPLPTMNINESSITGNAEVMEAIFTELGEDINTQEFQDNIRIVCGDQLSVANLRSVTLNRLGHDSPSQTFANIVTTPGLFHAQIHIVSGTLETHWGSAEGPQDPGSLHFHNTVLSRKPIVLSSLPPYRTCRDLLFVSLYARVFRCLELVSGCESLDEYPKSVTFAQLYGHATQIVDQYATAQVATGLRRARKAELQKREDERAPQGDVVLENAVLFMRDALLIREFTDAIKCGDSGRVVLCLKQFALSYRGCGRTKYAHEMLHIIHNFTHVWPKPLRKIVLDNWLVNTTGHVNAFLPLDLLQEHMNFWIKTIYNANGSNASWEWLEKISPCVDVLRQLATHMNSTLGSRLGQKHHAPDLSKDIRKLLDSLREKSVYEVRPGRTIDQPSAEVTNIVTTGLHSLPGPLREYNERFEQLRERYRKKPLIGDALLDTKTRSSRVLPVDAPSQLCVEPSNASNCHENDDEDLWAALEEASSSFAGPFTLESEYDFTLDLD